jgi:predicted GH43/DUF377 family glycosyl hydrolase
VGYVDVDARDPTRILGVSPAPVLDVGTPGAFDDNGVTPLSVYTDDNGKMRLYYAGWQLGVQVRYFLFMGLAISDDGGTTFHRVSRVPVLERSDSELHMRTGGHVRRAGRRWQMWYAGGSEWVSARGHEAKPRYALRHVTSPDGVNWPASGEVCLRPSENELGFGRPCVFEDGARLRMWYSLRTVARGYRIGYAESDDGLVWERRDDLAGIDVSDSGWDSEMIGLACLQVTPYGVYLFYNGNNYGESGFGVAIAEKDAS